MNLALFVFVSYFYLDYASCIKFFSLLQICNSNNARINTLHCLSGHLTLKALKPFFLRHKKKLWEFLVVSSWIVFKSAFWITVFELLNILPFLPRKIPFHIVSSLSFYIYRKTKMLKLLSFHFLLNNKSLCKSQWKQL